MKKIEFKEKKEIIAAVTLNKNTVVVKEDGDIVIETSFKQALEPVGGGVVLTALIGKTINVRFASPSNYQMNAFLQKPIEVEYHLYGTLYVLADDSLFIRTRMIIPYVDSAIKHEEPVCSVTVPEIPIPF